jgi:futalosine hydrolase
MDILIVAAMEMELGPLLETNKEASISSTEILPLGIGILSTAVNLMQRIAHKKPDLIIQTGIAGGIHEGISLGTAYCILSECLPEMGVQESTGYRDIFDMGFQDPNSFPFSEKRLFNPHQDLMEKTELPLAAGITVNQITTDPQQISIYQNQYKADVESMEGAAVHYIALMHQIPFVQIRGISNRVGERGTENWKFKEAIDASIASCRRLLLKLHQS